MVQGREKKLERCLLLWQKLRMSGWWGVVDVCDGSAVCHYLSGLYRVWGRLVGLGGRLRFGAVGQIRQMKCEPAAISYSWCDLSCGD